MYSDTPFAVLASTGVPSANSRDLTFFSDWPFSTTLLLLNATSSGHAIQSTRTPLHSRSSPTGMLAPPHRSSYPAV
ncbi:hypothetical protein SCLCIDRAFT_1207903 [Scleroderma citrinum Foug A]|uniref:Uncharacterized protein n=1 Tax=Scleroderma citrinum Foug A TaxID=1036808 RepID=A0A0C3AWW9_9AGAM|nr:hypothetical protein SCLCIDRAFT_1207903 [Scleroderma citrinum Foug A]